MSRVLRFIVYLIVTVGLTYGKAADSSSQDQSVHALRIAYLYYFSHFITWPNDTEFVDNEFGLCAVTNDIDDRFQLNTIEGKSLEGNRLIIIVINPSSQVDSALLKSCHLLFISSAHSNWLSQSDYSLSSYTLVVSEGEQAEIGLINLFMEDKKLKFEIDVDSLQGRGFKASSKLLRLAAKWRGAG